MKFIIALSCILAVAIAAEIPVKVLRSEQDVNPDSYHYALELDNGVKAESSGNLKNEETFAAQGQYQFQSPEGDVYSIQYVADENGYQPQGAHIPTPHPIPAAILRSLEYNAQHPPVEGKQ